MRSGETTVVDSMSAYRGNSRVARLARWFSNPPDGTETIVCAMCHPEGGEDIVGRWSHVHHTTASEVEEAITGYVQDVRESCSGAVRLLDGQANVLATRRVKADVDRPGDQQNQIEGNLTSALRLVQEHQAKLVKTLEEVVRWQSTSAIEMQRFGRDERHDLLRENERLKRTLEEMRLENTGLLVEGAQADDDSSPSTMVLGMLKEIMGARAGDGAATSAMAPAVSAASAIITPELVQGLQQMIRHEVSAAFRQRAARRQAAAAAPTTPTTTESKPPPIGEVENPTGGETQ